MTVLALQGTPVPPAPPTPPVPPGHELSVGGSLEGWDAVVLLAGVLITVAVLLWPLIRAVARRIEAGAAAAEARVELDELRERVRQLEQAHPRLSELEERLDFAERLLAQAPPGRLGAPTEESRR
jgi:hypothetical protein